MNFEPGAVAILQSQKMDPSSTMPAARPAPTPSGERRSPLIRVGGEAILRVLAYPVVPLAARSAGIDMHDHASQMRPLVKKLVPPLFYDLVAFSDRQARLYVRFTSACRRWPIHRALTSATSSMLGT